MTMYYTAAKVFTATDETTTATAFAVDGETFSWVGEAGDVPAGADVVDLGDVTVLPGMVDVHTHASYIAEIAAAVPCTVPVVRDIPSMIEALKQHPNAGGQGWIDGWGYDESKLAEHRTPTRHDLDLVSTTQPVHVMRSDCHSGICNTRALEIAGISAKTPDPEHGRFGRDEDGVPNGVLVEHGANQAILRAKGGAGLEADVRELVATNRHFLERGLVGVTDMYCVPGTYDHRDLFSRAEAAGFLPRVRFYYDFATVQESTVAPILPEDLEGRVALAGLKLFADGSMSNRTAWLRDPYPGTDDQFGMPTAPARSLRGALGLAREHGLQIAVHAMGDRALEEVIAFFEDVEPWLEERGVPSVRLEHATLLDPGLMGRMGAARMHFGVASNIDFFFAEHDSFRQNLTDEQYARAYMVKDLYERVPDCALTSDCPATTWADPDDPFVSMQAAVERRAYNGVPIVPEQAITIGQAILLYTSRAARLVDFPGLGQIAPGFEASFVTLDQDVLSVPSDRICRTQVTATWVRGNQEFDRA